MYEIFYINFFYFFQSNRADMKAVILLLTRCTNDEINATVSGRDLRTPIHLACAIGNLAISQILIWVSHQSAPKFISNI